MDREGNFKWYGRVSEEQWEALRRKRAKQRLYKSRLKHKYLIGKSFDRRIVEIIGKFKTQQEIVDFKNMVKSWNETCAIGEIPNVRREWVIMKRPDVLDDFTDETYLTDDMGKIVRIKLRSKKWELLERIPLCMDKTFAIMGDKRKPPLRYTFDEACETFIDVRLHETDGILPIYRMKNKIVFYYDNEPIKALICSTMSEADYFCFCMHKRYENNDRVLIFNKITDTKRDELIDELVEVTGVDRKRVADSRTNNPPKKKKKEKTGVF